ncbi:hypothetical protein BH23CHL1_BH23CHL1_20870 [soil metagenome]
MLHTIQNYKRFMAGLGLATMLTVSMAMPAFAATNDVSGTVTAGAITQSIAEVNIGTVATSSSGSSIAGSMILTVDDGRGTGVGWSTTVLAGPFAHNGGGPAIPATDFALTTAALPGFVAGQEINTTSGPRVPTAVSPLGALSTERTVLDSLVNFGAGKYTQALGVTLTVPAYTKTGIYTGAMTVTNAAAPTT